MIALYTFLVHASSSSLLLSIDMKNSKFYGLRGTKLNIAIAVVAGTDFALFGYGEHTYSVLPCKLILTMTQTRVLWAVF